ncbi:helix-turn-helix transcriptional regulator [Thermogemmatispora onikobensis]|uniref:helix-turn-helix transcriptional regulator n=1 Tax=Thermogemmatispora onikobensis TaxID=732234 RepID=UPI000853EAB9|nr:YafY family protein [Thermogemmatispora onikobensis]
MYFPTTRVLTVLELLQARGRMSGSELAARLEVSPRTVRRYITMLQDLGIPVEAEHGRYGAYFLRPGFRLPPLIFSDEEALALTLGLLLTRRLNLVGDQSTVERALAKIERVLPGPLRERLQAVEETLLFDLPETSQRPAAGVLLTVGHCTQQSRRLWLRYRSWNGTESEREVDPYGLVYRSGSWYLAGYCHLRQDIRVFRLDRILLVEERPAMFMRPADFDCLREIQRAIALTPAPWQIEVVLELPLSEVQQRLPSALAILEPLPENQQMTLLRCSTHNLDWAAYVLAGLNCRLQVRNPPALSTAFQALAQRISEHVIR